MNRERAGPHVIGDAPQPAAVLAGRVVLDAAHFAGALDERQQDVDVEIAGHLLQHRGRALQAHAGVDVLAGQRPQVVRRSSHAIELREHQVPDLDLAFVVGLEEDFAARAAHAVGTAAGRPGRPEIVVLAHPLDLVRRQLDVAGPDLGGLVVVVIDRDEQPVGIEAQPLLVGQKLPGPVDRLALEIVAEAEVAQHLEKRVVIGRAADVFDVAGAQAFLAGRGPGEFELHLAQEMILELVHARRREQHRGIPAGHQHVARPADAALGLEKGQIFFTQFVGFHKDRQFGP